MQAIVRVALPLVMAALLSACANNTARNTAGNAPVYSPSRQGATAAAGYGYVRSIESIGTGQGQSTGAGAVVGGVIGAIVGRQVSETNAGKNVGTAVGAVGGALIGNEIEKNSQGSRNAIRVTVQLEQGGQRSFDFTGVGDLRVGDRVRIDGDRLYKL